MKEPLRLVIADDHAVVRSGLKLLLESHGLQVVEQAATGEEAIEKILRCRPDLAILDLTMPPGIDGLEATRRLIALWPQARVLILSMHDDEGLKSECLKSGSVGYVLKQAPDGELVRAIAEACQQMQDNPKSPDLCPGLTQRECEVLRLLAQGYGNKEVSGLLDISVKTVETHRNHLFLKLQLNTRADLVSYALKMGLLRP